MASRMVIDLSKSSVRAEKAAFAYAVHAAERLRPLLEAGLEPGETLPDVELLVRLLGRALQRERLALIAADSDQGAGRRQAKRLRQRRAQHKDALRACLLEVRAGAHALLGKAAGDHFIQVEGRLSRDPVRLVRQAQDVRRALDQAVADGWKAPAGRLSAFDPAAAVEKLRAALEPFEQVVTTLVSARSQGILQMARKRKLYDGHRADLAHVTLVLEALLVTSGLLHEADDVRLRRRKKPRRPQESGPEAVAGGEADP